MPFQSEKQRRYLWANEPEIARDWTDTYGSRVKKFDGGGIMDYLMPAWNFSKGIYGDQNPTITSSMQQDLINRAQATGLDTGSLGYSDFGAESLGSGRFGGGIKSLAQEGGSPFANALSLGRVSFNRDPNAPGGYTFGDTKYDFNVDDTPTGTGLSGYLNPENILRGINYGGLKTAIPNFYGDFKAGAGNIWDAFKNEFGGSAEAAIPDEYASAQGVDVNNIRDLIAKSNMQKMMNASYSNVPEALDTSRFKGVYAGPGQGDEAGNYIEEAQPKGFPGIIGLIQNIARGAGKKLGMTQVSAADRDANKSFMAGENLWSQEVAGGKPITIDEQGRMVGGDFAGKIAPGKSGWGSKNFGEMAQSWWDKYGDMVYKTQKMIDKKDRMERLVKDHQRKLQQEREQTIKDYSTWTSPSGRDHPGTGGIGSPESKKGGAPGTSKGQASWKGYQGGLAGLWQR